MTQQTVLICGGGIGGLAAALVLSRQGYRVEVFEQSDAFKEIGAGIQIGPNAFRMFEHLGLTRAIDHVAYYPGNLCMRRYCHASRRCAATERKHTPIGDARSETRTV